MDSVETKLHAFFISTNLILFIHAEFGSFRRQRKKFSEMKKKVYEVPELKVHRVELTHMIANSIGDEEEMARQFRFEEDEFEENEFEEDEENN